MTAITKADPAPCSPPGYEFNDSGYASEAIDKGDPVIITSAAPASTRWDQVIAKATAATADGIALKDVKAGGTCEYGVVGEMDGFSGLTRGAPLSIVDGKIDSAAPVTTVTVGEDDVDVPAAVQIRAVTASRIRFNFS